jgi:hypothetical protein
MTWQEKTAFGLSFKAGKIILNCDGHYIYCKKVPSGEIWVSEITDDKKEPAPTEQYRYCSKRKRTIFAEHFTYYCPCWQSVEALIRHLEDNNKKITVS